MTSGLSKARLQRMHDVMAGHVERGLAPGVITLIERRGETHVDVIGNKALGGRDPMRRDTLFRITSMTKAITATAAMILVEECKLRLDDPVPAQRPISLRDLLTFRAGYGFVWGAADQFPILKAIAELEITGFGPPDQSTPIGPDEWLKRLATLPLIHQPGERSLYNTGSYILGVLIARASGQSFGEFLRERI